VSGAAYEPLSGSEDPADEPPAPPEVSAEKALEEIARARPSMVTWFAALNIWLVEACARGLARTDAAELDLRRALDAAARAGTVIERPLDVGGVFEWRLPSIKKTPPQPKLEDRYPWEGPVSW
jgi:hypothetical protein